MKKYLLYIILAFISLIPIIKVKASSSTEQDVYMNLNINNTMEWIYNSNSTNYLLNLVNNYDYKMINVKSTGTGSINNNTYYGFRIYVIGSNTQDKLWSRWRSGYISGFLFNQPIEKRYDIYIWTYDFNTFYDVNNQVITTITNYDTYYTNESTSIDLTESGGVTYANQDIAYTVYYNTFKLKTATGTNRPYILYDLNNNLVGTYTLGDVIPSYMVLYHGIPNYLQGYEKIGLSPSVSSVVISNVTKGSIYIPVEDFNKCYGIFGYFDKEKDFQTYDSIIENYTITDDGKYVKQDFDLDNYTGADYVFYQKCQYVTGEDDIYKWVYIPETSWSSPLESEANQNGGLDYTYNVMDENGNIVQESFSSLDGILSAEGNETLKNLINNIFKNNNNAILRYFNNLWENTKNYTIYNYLLIIISSSIIIYFIKIIKRR